MARLAWALGIALLALAGCELQRGLEVLLAEPPPSPAAAEPAPAPVEPEPPLRTARASEPAPRAPEPRFSPRSSFNRISSAEPSTAPRRRRSTARLTGGVEPGSHACETVRSNVRRYEAQIASFERQIEELEERANDVELHAETRERYEERADTASRQLAQAEDELHEFVLLQQQHGVPQGCLR